MYHGHYSLLSAGRSVCTCATLCATAISLQKVVQTLYVIFCDGEYFPVLCRLTI